MADAQHNTFVLKERQKLEARAKKLEKQEAEFAAMKEANAALEADLRAKTAQLAQTADMLRRRDEERDAARREAAAARKDLDAAKADAASAKAAAKAAAGAADEKKAREAELRAEVAEALASSQRDVAEQAQTAAGADRRYARPQRSPNASPRSQSTITARRRTWRSTGGSGSGRRPCRGDCVVSIVESSSGSSELSVRVRRRGGGSVIHPIAPIRRGRLPTFPLPPRPSGEQRY